MSEVELPSINIDGLRAFVDSEGSDFVRTLVPNLKQYNLDRTISLGENSRVLYLGNHTSQLDYFVPNYVILKNEMPYPRTIAGVNLKHWLIKRSVFDLEKGGVIWIDRSDSSIDGLKRYGKQVRGSFLQGDSIMVFPEGTRNRNPENGLLEFKDSFFRLALSAQRECDEQIYVQCFACRHEKRPEDGFFERIDRAKGGLGYYFWDVASNFHWRYFVRDKGKTEINFAEPVPLIDLAVGNKGSKSQAKRVSAESKGIVEGLLEEMG